MRQPMVIKKLISVDSDVVVLCIHHFLGLKTHGMKELWIGFGTGKSYKDIPIHHNSNILGDDASKAILFFMLTPVVT